MLRDPVVGLSTVSTESVVRGGGPDHVETDHVVVETDHMDCY